MIKINESFSTPLKEGSVIGSSTADGVLRKGVDREDVIGVDGGALRIRPLIEPGWGRAGIAYGPYERRNGLSFGVFMLNCHNTSQSESIEEGFRDRVDRWLRGPNLYSRPRRLLQWLMSRRKQRMVRQFRWWRRISRKEPAVPRIDENLALGWFASEVPPDVLLEGNGLVMHATGPENGELWARVGASMLPAVRGVQNLQIHYVVVLRERGAAYYASSVQGANGLGSYPNMRLLAIDAFNADPSVHAGIFQSTLGQIGFRSDTRVYGVRVVEVPEWNAWYGTAHAADRLSGTGLLSGSPAEEGGKWWQCSGRFERTANGVSVSDGAERNLAVLRAPQPSGLVHMVMTIGSNSPKTVGLVWRQVDPDNFWQVTVGASSCELMLRLDGRDEPIAHADGIQFESSRSHSLQVVDEGHRFSLYLNQALLFEKRFIDERLRHGTGVGIVSTGTHADLCLSCFEAHPIECRLPAVLDQGKPWWRLSHDDRVTEDFEGPSRDLEGKLTTTGGQTWRRTIGSGRIDVTGADCAKFRGSRQEPVPGRVAYTIEWFHPEFADLEVEITPPGTGRGQGEYGLCGFILWQDPKNYVMLNTWRHDHYAGASISSFFMLDGFEDLYDAIWTNVGNRVQWGASHRLRIAFDGMNYMALINDEPVLYRALTDVYSDARALEIRRVGLLGNWEWGNDTGSVLRRFRARA